LEYSGIGKGGTVAALEGRVIWIREGFTLYTGLKTAIVGYPQLTVTGHQSMAVMMIAGMDIVVVIVWTPPPAAEDSNIVVSGGHRTIVVEPIREGGSTSVQGGIYEAVAPPLEP
jgi:membrane-bound ClpP family serine protease